MELIHSHIALSPPRVSDYNSEIPPLLSNIVRKLMAKEAGNRYQTASGLSADLKQCFEALKKSGEIEPFELGQQDYSARSFLSSHVEDW